MNNKQSSVDWLAEIIRFANKELYAEMFEEIEQAKAMHKEEISQAFDDGEYNYFYSRKTGNDFEDGKEYYEEKFGE